MLFLFIGIILIGIGSYILYNYPTMYIKLGLMSFVIVQMSQLFGSLSIALFVSTKIREEFSCYELIFYFICLFLASSVHHIIELTRDKR